MKTDSSSERILIGRVGSAAGLRGEFRVNLYSAGSANLKEGKNLLFRRLESNARRAADPEDAGKWLAGEHDFEAVCKSVRYQREKPVIKVEGIDDRNSAEVMRGMEIFIDESELDELPEGEHYVRNLIGCTVRDNAGGRDVGILTDVIQNTAQSVLEVGTSDGRTVLIPAVDAFLRKIDEEGRLIEVELIPGFLE